MRPGGRIHQLLLRGIARSGRGDRGYCQRCSGIMRNRRVKNFWRSSLLATGTALVQEESMFFVLCRTLRFRLYLVGAHFFLSLSGPRDAASVPGLHTGLELAQRPIDYTPQQAYGLSKWPLSTKIATLRFNGLMPTSSCWRISGPACRLTHGLRFKLLAKDSSEISSQPSLAAASYLVRSRRAGRPRWS